MKTFEVRGYQVSETKFSIEIRADTKDDALEQAETMLWECDAEIDWDFHTGECDAPVIKYVDDEQVPDWRPEDYVGTIYLLQVSVGSSQSKETYAFHTKREREAFIAGRGYLPNLTRNGEVVVDNGDQLYVGGQQLCISTLETLFEHEREYEVGGKAGN